MATQLQIDWGVPRPMSEAPARVGTRVLAWCRAAESTHGWAEMILKKRPDGKKYWGFVIDHPWANACPEPYAWVFPPTAPKIE